MEVATTMEIIKEALEHCLTCPNFETEKKVKIRFALERVEAYFQSQR